MNLQNPTILIVDDEPELRELMEFHIQSFGYRTQTAASGNEALAVIRSQSIQVVISDVRMPDGTGIDLLREIRKVDPIWPRLFFVTGYADIDEVEAFDLGAEAYFGKPVNYSVLEVALADSLEPVLKGFPHRHVRVSCPGVVQMSVRDQAVSGELHNFSGQGMFVKADPKPNDLVDRDFEFHIDFRRRTVPIIKGRGQVKWIRPRSEGDNPAGYGICFTDLSDSHRHHLITVYNESRTNSDQL